MRIVPFSDESLAEAVSIILDGGVVAHATETCYGLACDMRNKKAVEKVFAIKQRSHEQPISALFASVDEARNYVEWNTRAEQLAKEYLPGPLTLILPLKTGALLLPTPHGGATLGVRVSSHEHAQALATATGIPISTTSANVHGQANPYSADDIREQFKDAEVMPDLVLDAGTLPSTPPSTIIDCTKEDVEQKRSGDIQIP